MANGLLKNALLRDAEAQCWLRFSAPVAVLEATDVDEVLATVQAVEERVAAERLYAVGFISYEAAPAFDSACSVNHSAGFPLVRFGLFGAPEVLDRLPEEFDGAERDGCDDGWQFATTSCRYAGKIESVKSHLRAGDSYQVNYTIRQHRRLNEGARNFFARMAEGAEYASYIECEDFTICSASPELFFDLDGDELTTRPMKGTAPRGDTPEKDCRMVEWLRTSEKNRAENLMIVDMIRNDIGRVAYPGSVAVTDLFKVEVYPTVLQMTSTVRARTERSIVEILQALFPCASITGAPKINTMRIIRDLEDGPRRLYTGAIGFMKPGRRARFSVAIRTAVVDHEIDQIEYGTGGAIVWDSRPEEEFSESRLKTRIVDPTGGAKSFDLLETILWTGREFYLFERHVTRLWESSVYFGFTTSAEDIRTYFQTLSRQLPEEHRRIRVFLSERGGLRHESLELKVDNGKRWCLGIASFAVDASLVWLKHKTTIRGIYDQARASHPQCDDVLLWNHDGLLTEATIANVAVRIGDQLCTPPVHCGLLAGTFRAEMLSTGKLMEREIAIQDINERSEIYLLNSVRQWIPARLDLNKAEVV